MKKYFDIVFVMPVGPGTDPFFAADTINSFIFYTASSFKIIVIDDSQQDIGKKIQKIIDDNLEILYTKKASGSWAKLYVTISNAFAYAINNYDFKLLMKIDTDALIIGPQPEKEAMELFSKNASIGIAGQYLWDYDGKPWNFAWPRDRILNGATTWKFIHRPIANIVLRKLYIKALKHGYVAGHNVFGGSNFMSRSLLIALHKNKLLPNKTLGGLNLGEDHLFGLLAHAVGFQLADLSTPGLPFALAWKELPASPEQLYNEGKKIIHSTRKWQGMNEEDIRNYFRQKRKQEKNVAAGKMEIAE